MPDAPPVLTLHSRDLLSKYGFGDGATPDELMDYWDQTGVTYPEDWRSILRALVRQYLLPALAEHHTIEVIDIDSHHNPIRAITIDGVPVERYWYTTRDGVSPALTPESVGVPYSAVAAAGGL